MRPSANRLRQTMLAQVNDLVDRVDTIRAMGDGMPGTGTAGGGRGIGGHADPTAVAAAGQADARRVTVEFEQVRRLLATAAPTARRLVPKVVAVCHGCGEPAGWDGRRREMTTVDGDVYHRSPCAARARRLKAG